MAAHGCARQGMMVWILALATFLSCAVAVAGTGRLEAKQRLEVQRHLRRLNKQAVKSIEVAPFSVSLMPSSYSFFTLIFFPM